MTDDMTLAAATERRFYFACSVCHRRGRYGKTSLIVAFGAQATIPSLPRLVAEKAGCPYVARTHLNSAVSCGAHMDLATMYHELKEAERAWKGRRG